MSTALEELRMSGLRLEDVGLQGFGFRVQRFRGLALRVWGRGFGVSRVWGFRVQDSELQSNKLAQTHDARRVAGPTNRHRVLQSSPKQL